MFKFLSISALLLITTVAGYAAEVSVSPGEGLKRMLAGNERYTKDKLEHPNRDLTRRESLVSKQTPFAVVIGCSDSRVTPEIVFDQGVGDLFVVRVAGNVMDPVELASVMYAIDYLHASLVFVLGHEGCGAVKAVLAHQTEDIQPIAKRVEASIAEFAKTKSPSLEEAVKANVKGVIAELKKDESLVKMLSEKKLGIVGGYYNLGSGKVELCCEL